MRGIFNKNRGEGVSRTHIQYIHAYTSYAVEMLISIYMLNVHPHCDLALTIYLRVQPRTQNIKIFRHV